MACGCSEDKTLAELLRPTVSWEVWTSSCGQSEVTNRVWVGERHGPILRQPGPGR